MPQTILTKTSSKGQSIEIKMKEYLPGQHIAQLFLDGEYVFGESRPVALAKPQGAVSHWLGGNNGKVGLTGDEAALILTTIEAADAATRTETTGPAAAVLPAEESRLLAAMDRTQQPGAAQTWHGQASMDAEDSHF